MNSTSIKGKINFPYGTEKKYNSSVPVVWKQASGWDDKKRIEGVNSSKSGNSESTEESSRWKSFVERHNIVIHSSSSPSSLGTNKVVVDSKKPYSSTNTDISSSQCSIVTNKDQISLGAVQQPVKV